MRKIPETFNEATRILNMNPLPKNAVQRMSELKVETPEEYKDEFNMFFEALQAILPGVKEK